MSHLPVAPTLEHLKNQARALLKALRAQDPAALARLQEHLPDLKAGVTLSNAQFVVAREYGFPSWPRLKAYVESLAGDRAARRRPLSTDVEWFDDRAAGLVRSHQDAIPSTLAQIREFHPRFAGMSDDAIRNAEFTLEDARLSIAREHGFESWRQFQRHLRALAAGKTVEPFLAAFEAIKAGDGARLESLLQQDPSLANVWGTNGNTLLNLAGSCRKPDAVEILISAGAEVNRANKYGWTPLHQAAYSNQADMARRLIESGGSLQLSARGDGGTPLVQALFWGHDALADVLSRYGIYPCNLRVAAGLGRLDLLEAFFDSRGKLTREAGLHRAFYRPHPGFPSWTPSDSPQEILDEALVYASKSGRMKVLPFLIDHGANVNGEPYNGTALHWAASGGRIEVVEWLLDHGAAVQGTAHFGGEGGLTPLHVAAWGGQLETVKCLVEHGADATVRDPRYYSTAIGWADHNDAHEVRDYLLEHTRMDLGDAIRFGKADRVVELLDADPAAINRPLYDSSGEDGSGEPALPLYQAIRSNQLGIVELLIRRGADLNPASKKEQRSPLRLSLQSGHQEIAALLQEHGARE